jgi:hypothetical protein
LISEGLLQDKSQIHNWQVLQLSFRTIHLPQRDLLVSYYFHKHYPEKNAAQTVRKWIPRWQENEDQAEEQMQHVGFNVGLNK